jgi:transcriptional regulator with XRE-family HTH domain
MEEDFAEMLKELREKAGLTQQALAVKAGLALSYISKLEGGRANPSWTTIKALAKALGKTRNDFMREEPFGGPEEPKKPRKGK